jgi:hypothetical protein
MRQRGGGDPQVVRADELPLRRQLSPEDGVNTRDLFGDLDRPHVGLGEAGKALGALVVLGTNCGDDCGWRRDHTRPPTATRANPPSETDSLIAAGTGAEVEARSAPAGIC